MPAIATENAADSAPSVTVDSANELTRQVDAYVALGYPALAGLSDAAFRELFAVLEAPLADAAASGLDLTVADARVPFVAVVTDAVVDATARVPFLRAGAGKKEGILDRNYGDKGIGHYRAIDDLELPEASVYLLLNVDRGDEFKNVKPMNALPVIAGRGRTPLTIAEGLSFNAVYPDRLVKNHCFMLAGSHEGTKRVPAIWISQGSPKLGWCFQGVEHTWLGIASAGSRVA
jgi:hypothetical protein